MGNSVTINMIYTMLTAFSDYTGEPRVSSNSPVHVFFEHKWGAKVHSSQHDTFSNLYLILQMRMPEQHVER